jgi:hypothetical protein
MKTIAIVVVIIGTLPWLVAEDIQPPKIGFEPLSLTISKFKRDNFGKGVNPFRMDMGAVSGVSLIARVNLDAGWAERLVIEDCKLKRFVDDRQTNLLASDEGKADTFWENNRPLSLMPSHNKADLGVTIRGANLPADGARKLVIEGEFVFAPEGGEEDARRDGFELLQNDIVELDPVRLRFTKQEPRPGLDGEKAGKDNWYVQVLPNKGVSRVKLLLFGKDEDVPVFGGPSASWITKAVGKKAGSDDPFRGVSMQGFACPGGKLSRIVVRYVPTEKLIKAPFKWETEFGLSGSSPGEVQ